MSVSETLTELFHLVRDALEPVVHRALQEHYKEDWIIHVQRPLPWDLYGVLRNLQTNWTEVFQARLAYEVRRLSFDLKNIRNRFAHQEAIENEEVATALLQSERMIVLLLPLYTDFMDTLSDIVTKIRLLKTTFFQHYAANMPHHTQQPMQLIQATQSPQQQRIAQPSHHMAESSHNSQKPDDLMDLE